MRRKISAAGPVGVALALVLVASGCRTMTAPGSVYQRTGRIVDLLAEPTFDVGAGPPQGSFYSFRVPHYDADGHGFFDVPVVFCEQLMFAPEWVCSAALRLSGSEPYVNAPRPRGPGVGRLRSAYWLGRKGIGWVFVAPGVGCYAAGLAGTMAFDTVVHDLPVIVVGLPGRLARRAGLRR